MWSFFLISLGMTILPNSSILLILLFCAKIITSIIQEELKKMVLSCTEMKNEQIEYLLEDSILKGNANIVPIIVDNDRSGLLIEYNKVSI